MKLKVFTIEETEELIQKIQTVISNIVKLGQVSVELLNTKYQTYLDTFRPGVICCRSPLSYKEFLNKMNYYNNWVRVDELVPNGSEFKNAFGEFRIFRTAEFCLSTLRDYHMTKRSDASLSNEETKFLLTVNDYYHRTYYNTKMAEKYNIVMKYATRPFEIEEDDVWFVERIQYMFEHTNKLIEEWC